ncbi:MAG: hypothetical protein D6812_14125 [Deltaproteobacteria bacterium]|nr:MAG: hypothetical protein D6812_14125 [Deltaproteobacteria bacterium]
MVPLNIEGIFVLTCPSHPASPPRMERFEKVTRPVLESFLPGVPIHIYNGVCPRDEVSFPPPPHWWNERGSLGNTVTYYCLQAHLGYYQEARRLGYNCFLILEDDVVPRPTFPPIDLQTVKVPASTPFIYLGGQHKIPPHRIDHFLPVDSALLRAPRCNRFHAVVCRWPSYPHFEYLHMACMHPNRDLWGHHFSHLDHFFDCTVHARSLTLATHPWMFIQGENESISLGRKVPTRPFMRYRIKDDPLLDASDNPQPRNQVDVKQGQTRIAGGFPIVLHSLSFNLNLALNQDTFDPRPPFQTIPTYFPPGTPLYTISRVLEGYRENAHCGFMDLYIPHEDLKTYGHWYTQTLPIHLRLACSAFDCPPKFITIGPDALHAYRQGGYESWAVSHTHVDPTQPNAIRRLKAALGPHLTTMARQ